LQSRDFAGGRDKALRGHDRLLFGRQWEAFPPDLEADSEASLLRAGPKDPASRIRPILRRLVPISSNASPNCWPLRDAQPVGVLPVEVRICTLARREPIEQALTYPLVHHPERVRDDHRFRFKPLAFLTKPE